MDFGSEAIQYIGSTDKQNSFRYSTSFQFQKYNKYR